ncbi:MAG TPA: adenosylcobinamide amidohydrolase [Thermoleophilia bacterium]|nr:adenosylcobinamide amidohydrolase [Thermoleophilia bacterium]
MSDTAPTNGPATAIPGIAFGVDETAVRVTSDRPLATLSSAIIGGGFAEVRDIVNMHVDDLGEDARPEDELRAFVASLGVAAPWVGLMTAAKTENARLAQATDGLSVASVVSVGLSNRACAGLSPPAAVSLGTINAIAVIDAALTPAAMVNAVITATEAKAMALLAWDVRTADGLPASGTTTDSVVVACTRRGAALDYAGPGTFVGWLVAHTVRQAIEQVCRDQLARDGGRRVGW